MIALNVRRGANDRTSKGSPMTAQRVLCECVQRRIPQIDGMRIDAHLAPALRQRPFDLLRGLRCKAPGRDEKPFHFFERLIACDPAAKPASDAVAYAA